MIRANPYWIIGLALLAVSGCGPSEQFDVVVRRGHLIDPDSGLDAVRNIGIQNGRIMAISSGRMSGDLVIDAKGLIVSPGFIDLHSHGQTEENYRLMVQDGVTSALELELGTADVSGWYDERVGEPLMYPGGTTSAWSVKSSTMVSPQVIFRCA
jgi:hypothetical protein